MPRTPHTPRPPAAAAPPCSTEFEVGKEIGRGQFSVVLRAKHRLDGTEYAIKRSRDPLTNDREKNQWLQVGWGWGGGSQQGPADQ